MPHLKQMQAPAAPKLTDDLISAALSSDRLLTNTPTGECILAEVWSILSFSKGTSKTPAGHIGFEMRHCAEHSLRHSILLEDVCQEVR